MNIGDSAIVERETYLFFKNRLIGIVERGAINVAEYYEDFYTAESKMELLDSVVNRLRFNSDDFYIINVSAVDSKSRANEQVATLRAQGYDADCLWIPDYPSLSGASYYSVFIGPFETIDDCALAVKEYRKHDPKAYGLLVSDKNKRIEIRGPEKIKIIDPYP